MGETVEGTARLVAGMAYSYGLSSVEDWRWIKQGESPGVATFVGDGRRYVARLFSGEDALPRADYISELALHLGSSGVDVEEVVRTAWGEPFVRLQGGVPVVVSRFYPDSAHVYAVRCRRRPSLGAVRGEDARRLPGLVSPRDAPEPVAAARAKGGPRPGLGPAALLQEPRGIVERTSVASSAAGREPRAARPVHGDLWPGNLLGGPHGLRAIDFAEAGDGPRTIDLATAFRWMPWRDDPAGATGLWSAWLSGYCEAGTISQAELDAVPAVACLQHLTWMIAEVRASTEAAETSWYVEDHCSEVQALLSASVT